MERVKLNRDLFLAVLEQDNEVMIPTSTIGIVIVNKN